MNDHYVNGMVTGETPTHYQVSLDSDGDCKGCGLNNVCSNKVVELEKTLYLNRFTVGQKVQIEYKKVVQTSLIVYILPILFFFLGIVFSKVVFQIDNELFLFVNSMIATGIALLLVNFINKNYGDSKYKVDINPIKS